MAMYATVAFVLAVIVALKVDHCQPDSLSLGYDWWARPFCAFAEAMSIILGGFVGAIIAIILQLRLKKQKCGAHGGQSYSLKASGPDWSFEASGTGGKICTKDGPASKCTKNNDSTDTGESGSGRQDGSGNS